MKNQGLRERIKQAIKLANKEDVPKLKQILKDYDSVDGLLPEQVSLLHKYGLKV